MQPNRKSMNETQYISDFLAPRDAWDKLSIEEQAAMMKTAVSEGILDLGAIRQKYNEFAEGGNTDDDLVDWIIREEGFIANPRDIGDGKMTLGSGLTAQKWHDQYKRNGNKWTSSDNRRAVREEVANRRRWAERNIPNWDSLPSSSQKALLSYKYNYDFNRTNSPKLFKALSDSNLQEAARQMDATSSNPIFKKGLQDRRQREQEWFLKDIVPQQVQSGNYLPAVSTQVYNPYVQQVEATRMLPIDEPDPNSYIRTREVSPQEQRRRKFQENVEAYQRFNALMDLIDLRNNPTPSYNPIYSLFGGNTEGFAKGGKIHIKPENRGKFTALKERTGHSATWFKEHGTPAQKKMATFALNARKWKHGLGGNLFDGNSQPTQKMKIGRPYYSYDENGRKIDDTLNYNISFPEVVIIPDSKKSPAKRNEDERYRQRTQRDYAEQKSRSYTERQIANSQKEWENSLEKEILNYGQAAATGIGIGADMVSGLPVYSSLKGARVLSEAKAPLDYIEGGLWLTPLFSEAYQTAKPMVTTAVNDIFTNHPALYQYPRYVVGKLKYGMDAELPTVFRKFNTLPKIENGKVIISNPNSRFAYDNGFGEQSPIITNFTTDAPVRSHSAGNWDRDLTLAFPGKKLLGKRVISTQPSDTFTFGDNITIPTKDITGFSGRQKELDYLESNGMKPITSPEAEVFWESGASDLASKIAQARTTNAKIFQNRGKGIVLLKPKTPYGDFSNYANTIENLTRETFKSPTLKDYQFMDYVFRPKFTSDVAPKVENFTFDFINKNPMFGEWLGNSERRTYLNQPWRWGNLMYDPLTPVESEFRSELNIGLKPEFKR